MEDATQLYCTHSPLFRCSVWRLYPSVRRAIWQRGQFQCHGTPESAGAKLNPSCTCIGMKTPPEFGCGRGTWTLDKSTYTGPASSARCFPTAIPARAPDCMSGSGMADQHKWISPGMCWLWHCPHRSHRIAIRIRKQPTAIVAFGEPLPKATISTC